jgi:ectoine hydroxylase-related dioxygenase (phytanoyl-CoA dioxygenase family)
MDSKMKKHIEELDILGYTVIEDVLTPEEVAEVKRRITDIYELQKKETEPFFDLTTTDENNIARAPYIYDDYFYPLLSHPTIMPYVKELLGDYFVLFGQNGVLVQPEEEHSMGRWHRDLSHMNFVCDPLLAVNMFFCITDFNESTGATKVVPHSHKIGYPPSPEYLEKYGISVNAKAGSAFFFNAMSYHKSGTNTSGETRIGLSHMYTKYILKQQMDIPALLDYKQPDDPFMQMLLGFGSWVPNNVLNYRKFRYEAGLKKTKK